MVAATRYPECKSHRFVISPRMNLLYLPILVSRPIKFPFIFSLCGLAICGVVGAASEDLVINEIHYQPDDEFATEFIEIHNNGATPVELGGW